MDARHTCRPSRSLFRSSHRSRATLPVGQAPRRSLNELRSSAELPSSTALSVSQAVGKPSDRQLLATRAKLPSFPAKPRARFVAVLAAAKSATVLKDAATSPTDMEGAQPPAALPVRVSGHCSLHAWATGFSVDALANVQLKTVFNTGSKSRSGTSQRTVTVSLFVDKPDKISNTNAGEIILVGAHSCLPLRLANHRLAIEVALWNP